MCLPHPRLALHRPAKVAPLCLAKVAPLSLPKFAPLHPLQVTLLVPRQPEGGHRQPARGQSLHHRSLHRELVRRLCLADGRILRAAEPAVPTPESIFIDSYQSDRAFRALAPIDRESAVVVRHAVEADAVVAADGRLGLRRAAARLLLRLRQRRQQAPGPTP